jgi:hypothetical protein
MNSFCLIIKAAVKIGGKKKEKEKMAIWFFDPLHNPKLHVFRTHSLDFSTHI